MDIIVTRNSIDKFILEADLGMGIIIHIIVYEANPIKGLAEKIILLDVFMFTHSFVISFRASDIGCMIPLVETLFGPLRLWLTAISFRSANVKNATLSKTGTKITIVSSITLIKGFRPLAFALFLLLRQVLLLYW